VELTVDSRADGSALTARARCGSLCPPVAHSPVAVESLARRYEMWRPHLTERRRRLWLGGRGAGAACGWAGGGRPSGGGACGHGAARSRSRGARRFAAAGGCGVVKLLGVERDEGVAGCAGWALIRHRQLVRSDERPPDLARAPELAVDTRAASRSRPGRYVQAAMERLLRHRVWTIIYAGSASTSSWWPAATTRAAHAAPCSEQASGCVCPTLGLSTVM
jgi:hypothetical protein